MSATPLADKLIDAMGGPIGEADAARHDARARRSMPVLDTEAIARDAAARAVAAARQNAINFLNEALTKLHEARQLARAAGCGGAVMSLGCAMEAARNTIADLARPEGSST